MYYGPHDYQVLIWRGHLEGAPILVVELDAVLGDSEVVGYLKKLEVTEYAAWKDFFEMRLQRLVLQIVRDRGTYYGPDQLRGTIGVDECLGSWRGDKDMLQRVASGTAADSDFDEAVDAVESLSTSEYETPHY
jgi:hypothetical protein